MLNKIVIILAFVTPACNQTVTLRPLTPQERITTGCEHVKACFPRASLPGCIVGAVNANKALPEYAQEGDLVKFESAYAPQRTCTEMAVITFQETQGLVDLTQLR